MYEIKFLLTGCARLQLEKMIRKTIGLKTIADGDEPLLALRVVGAGVVFQEQIVEDDSGLKERLMHCRRVQLRAEDRKFEISNLQSR